MTEPGIRAIVQVVGQSCPVYKRSHQQEHGQDGKIRIQRDIDDLLADRLHRRFPPAQHADPDKSGEQHRQSQGKPKKRDGEKPDKTDKGGQHMEVFSGSTSVDGLRRRFTVITTIPTAVKAQMAAMNSSSGIRVISRFSVTKSFCHSSMPAA